MKNVPVTPRQAYSLTYDPDLHAVVLRWLAPYTLLEVGHTYAAAFAMARRYGCGRWLLDARLAGHLSADVTRWLTRAFFPVVARRLAPRRLRLAVVCSAARLLQQRTDAAVRPAIKHALAAEQPYEASLFTEDWEARAWLLAVLA